MTGIIFSGPGPHPINTSHNGMSIFMDNSDPNFGAVTFDVSLWTMPGFQCRVKRIWNRFGVVGIQCPVGNAPNGLPYRIDEFFTVAWLLEPMCNFDIEMSPDGRLYTFGKDYFRWSGHRTVDGANHPSYQMGVTDRGAVLKCTPSQAPNQAQLVVLPPSNYVTGSQINDGLNSYLGCFYAIVNCDPPGSPSFVSLFPWSGESLDSGVNQKIDIHASEAVILYQSGDGTRILSRSTANV